MPDLRSYRRGPGGSSAVATNVSPGPRGPRRAPRGVVVAADTPGIGGSSALRGIHLDPAINPTTFVATALAYPEFEPPVTHRISTMTTGFQAPTKALVMVEVSWWCSGAGGILPARPA